MRVFARLAVFVRLITMPFLFWLPVMPSYTFSLALASKPVTLYITLLQSTPSKVFFSHVVYMTLALHVTVLHLHNSCLWRNKSNKKRHLWNLPFNAFLIYQSAIKQLYTLHGALKKRQSVHIHKRIVMKLPLKFYAFTIFMGLC